MRVPFALFVIEWYLAFLAVPKRFRLGDTDHVEPWVSGRFVGHVEEDIYFLEGAICCFGIKEVYKRHDGGVCAGEDDEGSPSDTFEGDGRYENDTVRMEC